MHHVESIRTLAVFAAFGIDHFLGEPPARWHPVVWIGKVLGSTSAPWPTYTDHAAFVWGAAVWLGAAAVASSAAWLATMALDSLVGSSSVPALLLQGAILGALLKPLLAWRMLCEEVAAVDDALAHGLEAARLQLQHLVSRDTALLSEPEVRESVLESLAENLNDSLVAPLFWFVIGGLPGAALYRFANTADAQWGYRGAWEWAGKWAARADDVLSYVPARLSAVLLALSARRPLCGLRPIARVTPSPNGGWPMGMLALALGVRLSKPGVYVLNPAGAGVKAHHVHKALQIARRAAGLAVIIGGAVLLLLGGHS